MARPRSWEFFADMNFDGVTTISDVGLWIQWLYFYPGDWLLRASMKAVPTLTRFLEISQESYGGAYSGLISAIAWIMLAMAVVTLPSAVYGVLTEATTWRNLRRLGYILVAMLVAAAVCWPFLSLVSFFGDNAEVQLIVQMIVFWPLFGAIIWYMKRRRLHR